MKNSKIESISPNIPQPSKFQSALIRFLENKKNIYSVIGLIIVICTFGGLSYSYYSRAHAKRFDEDQKSMAQSEPNIKKLKKIAANYPTLQPRLDAPLAQEMINHKQIKSAKLIADRMDKRQKGHLEYVKLFNAITFLIEEGQYKEARAKSYVLKEALLLYPGLKTLYGAHLIRLVALEDLLGNTIEKAQLLKEVQDLNHVSGEMHQNIFTLGKMNIAQFLNGDEG